MKRTPIGLDLDGDRVHAVQLAGPRTSRRIVAASRFRLPFNNDPYEPERLLRIADTLDRQGCRGHDCVIAAPPSMVMESVFEFPPRSSGAPIDQLARMELARTFRQAPEELEVACWDLPAPARAGDSAYVLATACRVENAESLLDAVESAGFNVIGLDVRPCALARSAATLGIRDHVAIAHIGEHESLIISVLAGTIIYERKVSTVSLTAARQHLGEELDLEPDVVDHVLERIGLRPDREDSGPETTELVRDEVNELYRSLATEVDVSMSYVETRYPDARLDELILTGPGASIAATQSDLENLFRKNVRVFRPAECVGCPDALLSVCADPGLSLALGLADFQS